MKSFLHILLAFMLAFSILAPTLVDVLVSDYGLEVVEVLGDEDSKKEKKNELDQKEFFYIDAAETSLITKVDTAFHSYYYQNLHGTIVREIYSPPPELG
jgi:hypothetical protein